MTRVSGYGKVCSNLLYQVFSVHNETHNMHKEVLRETPTLNAPTSLNNNISESLFTVLSSCVCVFSGGGGGGV